MPNFLGFGTYLAASSQDLEGMLSSIYCNSVAQEIQTWEQVILATAFVPDER